MPSVSEMNFLPSRFQIEHELREQLSSRAGHQRCVEGAGELLLVLHEVPQAGSCECEILLFWKQRNHQWMDSSGRIGLAGARELLGRYEHSLKEHGNSLDHASSAKEIFTIIRHTGPLAHASRHLAAALQHCLELEPDDSEMRVLSDHMRDVERTADFLYADAQAAMAYWQAKCLEEQLRFSSRLQKDVLKLKMLSAHFLLLAGLSGLVGMSDYLHRWAKVGFRAVFFAGLVAGVCYLTLAIREIRENADSVDRGS